MTLKGRDVGIPGWPLAGELDRRPLAEALGSDWPGEDVEWVSCRWQTADPTDVAEPALRELAVAVAAYFDGLARREEPAPGAPILVRTIAVDALPPASLLRLLDAHWTWTVRRLQALADGAAVGGPLLSAHDLAQLDELAETEYYVRRARAERGEPVGMTLRLEWRRP